MQKRTIALANTALLTLFLTMNWWMQGINTTNGLWHNLFNLSTTASLHIAWYTSILTEM